MPGCLHQIVLYSAGLSEFIEIENFELRKRAYCGLEHVKLISNKNSKTLKL